MHDGYTVNLQQMESFAEMVQRTIGNYATINDTLAKAIPPDDGDFGGLYKEPTHHIGAPNDFAEQSKLFVERYQDLLRKLHGFHTEIHTQLTNIAGATVGTVQAYRQQEEKQAALFRNAMPDRGDDHGTA
jgi:hypothetical protein